MADADTEAVREIALANGQPPEGSGADRRYQDHIRRRGALAVATDEESGAVVAFGGAVPVGGFRMLTDLFVHPDWHGRGTGRTVLEAVWPDDGTPRCTFSSTHPHALSLYLRAGVEPAWPLLYLEGEPGRLAASPLVVERVSGPTAAAAEAGLTGVDRSEDYEFWLGRDPRATGLILRSHGETIAASAAPLGSLEHLCCPQRALASDAVVAALQAVEPLDGVVRLCLPGPHPAVATLLQAGFRIEEFDLYMATDPGLVPVTSVLSPALA